ncbi:MAG: sulfatase family protein [Candidatus Helarchaeota archaeon]
MKNIILICIDTLSSKHLGCYGWNRKTSPNIDKFSKDAIVFENAYANNNATHPSFTTILTGRHPLSHEIIAHQGKKELNENILNIAQILRKEGYKTVAFDNMYRWFRRGFEEYKYPAFKNKFWYGISPSYTAIGATQLTNRIIKWLKSYKKQLNLGKDDRNFFLFLHYWDPHFPYLPPKKYRKIFYNGNKRDKNNRSMEPVKKFIGWFLLNVWISSKITDIEWIKSLYDSEIKYLDDNLGRLFNTLQELGFYDDSLIIFTSDHGEIMQKEYDEEHGIYFMHFLLLDDTIRVPFIVKLGNSGKKGRNSALIQHSDIVPTMLEWAGIKSDIILDGKSLISLVNGIEKECHKSICSLEHTALSKRALITKKWKLITTINDEYLRGTPYTELYNRENDSEEKNNLVNEYPDVVKELEQQLKEKTDNILKKAGLKEDPQKIQEQAIKEVTGYKFMIWLFGRLLYSHPRH